MLGFGWTVATFLVVPVLVVYYFVRMATTADYSANTRDGTVRMRWEGLNSSEQTGSGS